MRNAKKKLVEVDRYGLLKVDKKEGREREMEKYLEQLCTAYDFDHKIIPSNMHTYVRENVRKIEERKLSAIA